MRKNLPVTDHEYVLADDTLIVSKTDLKGKITYFNDEFAKVSGFSDDELMGRPHNIVRHPDMPPAAFANLWDTIKAGKPWAGAVKNRRKNGDFYWVFASATPDWEGGQITGYTSIRTKLPADLREEAERVYALLRDDKAGGYRVDAGMIRRRSFLDVFAFFTGTLRARIATLAATLMTLMALSSAAGHFGGAASIAILGLGWLVGGLLTFSTMRALGGPLAHLNELMAGIVQGRFDGRVTIPRDDEVGIALRNIQALQAKLGFDRESRRDMEARAVRQRKADMHKVAGDFETAVGDIVQTVASTSTRLEGAVGVLTRTADSTQQLSVAVASASEEASANVQSVASATEELSSSVSEISRQLQEAARMAGEAVTQARDTSEHVHELSKAATRISDVVELISSIAGQTNLLALNATIEAARAGEAGRGFAVVASEVKALAEQTAKATGEIGQQIDGIQAATTESVGAIQAISNSIEKLSEISSAIAAAVEEQGAATEEIARNVQQAAHGTQQVTSNIVDVQRGTTDTGTASSQVLSAAQALSADSGRLKTAMQEFLATIRAA
ncbi:PAS domain-containing methyl-accepting chemotaxis protein [Bradyrhizobium sp.]|uniref:methyl-accepting chemotaxis protein n=1 Tax=Bradyrhizobium sp. TaxID=376 RepID=UPI002397872B|nr:PAS domain-containing methyl-accepting chemotaxis protein [Bradyrhizobium sp.]MDE2379053.1 methyl-accepting chemotaxis protein [Bradyrhizobium sp.]